MRYVEISYNEDFRQVMPRRLLTPEETLNTSEMNHRRFTKALSVVSVYCNENCNMVAVTLEKNVEIVVMLTYCVVAFSSSSATKVGNAVHSRC